MNKKTIRDVVFGAAVVAGTIGVLVALEPGNAGELRRLQEENQELRGMYERVVEQHEQFLSEMPNYDPTSMWIDGSKYTAWMVKDINEKYKR